MESSDCTVETARHQYWQRDVIGAAPASVQAEALVEISEYFALFCRLKIAFFKYDCIPNPNRSAARSGSFYCVFASLALSRDQHGHPRTTTVGVAI